MGEGCESPSPDLSYLSSTVTGLYAQLLQHEGLPVHKNGEFRAFIKSDLERLRFGSEGDFLMVFKKKMEVVNWKVYRKGHRKSVQVYILEEI